ncbi:MAG: hypothetical protein CL487_01435 [Acidobacteria bacterium]|nr:hypothetical protein [Acidobacteriota bacterium]
MKRRITAAIDFPRMQLRVILIGTMISLGVLTGWLVLADTHITVVIQFAVMAVYVMTVANSFFAVTDLGEILGRGFVGLGTVSLLCGGLMFLHTDLPLSAAAGWPQGPVAFVGAVLFAAGLWIMRPITNSKTGAAVEMMASSWPEFGNFHREYLAAPMAEAEAARRKAESDYWKLTAVGVPVAVGTGLILIISNLALRPPEWLFLLSAFALLLCSVGAAKLRWLPAPVRTEEILRILGEFVGLQYHFGGGEDPGNRTMTVFDSSRHASDLFLLPAYRELKVGASFQGSRDGLRFVFGELTTIPPRKLGQNTARMTRNFLLLVVETPTVSTVRTICYEERGPLGHRGLHPNLASDDKPDNDEEQRPLDKAGAMLFSSSSGRVSIVELGLKNGQFARSFTIYTEDQNSARKQLSHRLMAAVMNVREVLPPGEIMRFAFSGGQFFAAIETPRSWLEIDPPRPMAMDDPHFAAGIIERLQMVLQIVGSLVPDGD